MLTHREDQDVLPLFDLAFGKRHAEELYAIKNDPAQLNNLAGDPAYAAAKEKLASELGRILHETGDPRALGQPMTWDSDPYYGRWRPPQKTNQK